jgi:hypothetical protein
VEGGKTDAEEIGRTTKIKHTQNKQRKNNTGKNQNRKIGRTNKIQKYNGKQSKNEEIKCQTINRRGSDKIWPEAPLRKVAMGERCGGDTHMTCHKRRATKTPRSGRPKQGEKPTTRKKKWRGNRKKKGRSIETKTSSK